MKPKENKNTFTYAFKQQILRAWQPVPTLYSTVTIFIILGLVFLGLGIALIILSGQVIEYKERYDETCMVGDVLTNPCSVTINIEEKMEAPVFVYYELHNFYQNHRRYLKSRDSDQLAGDVKSVSGLDDCDPVTQNKDIAEPLYSYTGILLDPEGPANPCGLVAKSYFTDTYQLSAQGSTTPITINSDDIAWEADVKHKFKLPSNSESIQWVKVTDPHFIVWMRTAATPNFRKLWGKIETDLEPGQYVVKINNKYDVSSFDGEKLFVLSTANVFGGKNYFLAIAYLVVGGIALVVALLFFIKDKMSPPRHLPKFE